MLSDEETKVVRVLEGCIAALDLDNFTAKIFVCYEGIMSFKIRIYITFNGRTIEKLTDSMATFFYDDYMIPQKWVRIGLNKDNELIHVEKIIRKEFEDTENE